jgi:hypothetical protein
LLKYLLNKIKYYIFNIRFSSNLDSSLSTSLSDNQIYPDFCNKASLNSKIFLNFRRSAIYHQILEHVTKDVGQIYLDEIKKNNINLLNFIDIFLQNDKWGNPEVHDYDEIGSISPSTLRYIKVYGDLLKLFDNLNNFKICEIGVGYGGQSRIINSIEQNIISYTLVDIKPALRLTQRYLDNFSIESVLHFKTMNELAKDNYDLVISNYAFTELPRSVQEVYLKKIILNSKRGYITYNEITPDYFNSYKLQELLDIIPNSYTIAEEPLTHKNNCIIIWK